MSSARLGRLALALFLAPAFGCTDATLYGAEGLAPPDVLTLEGSVCTDDPAERQFPVKVLFLVDTSMSDSDYVEQRANSIERVVRAYPGSSYSFSVVRYAGLLKGTPCGQRNLTPDGYTRNTEDAVAGLRCSDTTNPGRDINNALSLAGSIVTGDLLQTPLGIRARTKYVVVLFANGAPTGDLSNLWCAGASPPRAPGPACEDDYYEAFCGDLQPPPVDCERAQYVNAIRNLKNFVESSGAQEFFFHAVYQRDPDASRTMMDDPLAPGLFAEMALAGGGSLYRFPTSQICEPSGPGGGGCLFAAVNLESTEAVFERKQLIVSNRNALSRVDGPEIDTDGDGLSDTEELAIGTCPTAADSDGDLLNDRVEDQLRAVGLDPLKNQAYPDPDWPVECPVPETNLPEAFPPGQDLDGDRLTDCEENLLRTNRTLYDSDADGLPDSLEFRYGTNPIDPDPLRDTDADGFFNVDEYRLHLDPLSRDRTTNYTYDYEIANEGQRSVMSFTQPTSIIGVAITEVSDGSTEGRATLYYEPPPAPNAPITKSNRATLSWRDPQDNTITTRFPADPGRGQAVSITGDGTYTLQSADSVAKDPKTTHTVTITVVTATLPIDKVRQDIRLRRSERFCFDFRVSNVQLVNTGSDQACVDRNGNGRFEPDEVPKGGNKRLNFVDVYLAEVPTNNPTSFGVFRVATIPAKYPTDLTKARGREQKRKLKSEDFLLFGD